MNNKRWDEQWWAIPLAFAGLIALLFWFLYAHAEGFAIRCLKTVCCFLGLHGKDLQRISSNTFHIDYRCKYCRREKIVFRH